MYIWCGKAFLNCALLFTTIVSLRANANRREKSEISSSPQHTSTWLTSWLRGCPWSQQQWRDLFQILYLWVVSVYFFLKQCTGYLIREVINHFQWFWTVWLSMQPQFLFLFFKFTFCFQSEYHMLACKGLWCDQKHFRLPRLIILVFCVPLTFFLTTVPMDWTMQK